MHATLEAHKHVTRISQTSSPLWNLRASRRHSPQRQWQQRCRASLKDDLAEVQGKVREREAAMQQAASAEDYKSAVTERDALNMLKLQQRRVELELDKENRIIRYEIGMVIRHRRYSYRGVILGHDDHCTAPEAWIQHMGVDSLPKGRRQPFYHVLVDENDRPTRGQTASSTYVAQENIEVLPAEEASQVQNQLIEHNFERFVDGRYLPKEHLAQQFSTPPGEDEDSGSAAPPDIKPDA